MNGTDASNQQFCVSYQYLYFVTKIDKRHFLHIQNQPKVDILNGMESIDFNVSLVSIAKHYVPKFTTT